MRNMFRRVGFTVFWVCNVLELIGENGTYVYGVGFGSGNGGFCCFWGLTVYHNFTFEMCGLR